MRRTSFRNWPCSIARTVDILGDWWTPLVLREAFFGVRRFEEMQQALTIGRNVLAARLRRLVREGILERKRYQDHPKRYEYLLTEKGRDLFSVLAVIMRWGDRWMDRGAGPPLVLRHSPCGELTSPEVICTNCREPLDLKHIGLELGPGFPPKLAATASVRGRFPRGLRPARSDQRPASTS